MGYIDGFNLEFGLRAHGWRKYLWLDPALLTRNLLKPHQALVSAKYFTARLSGPGPKWEQQKSFLEALETREHCSTLFGRYQDEPHCCSACGFQRLVAKEKMTDVNIATELVSDAYENLYDTAILVSGDADLTPAVRKVLALPGKRIVVAFPPKRVSQHLRQSCSASFVIGRAKLSASQLPGSVEKSDGTILNRPLDWQ